MTEMYKSRWDEIGLSDDFIFGKVMQKPKLFIGEMLAQGFSEEQIKAVCKATDEEIEAAKKQ